MELKTLLLFLCFGLIQQFASAALGIERDATPARYYHWSAAHNFEQDEETLHAALPSLARQAYEEMMADVKKNNVDSDKVPATMAALAVGKDVYFSSSIKGGPFLLTPSRKEPRKVHEATAAEVKRAIIHCQQAYNKEHRFGMACAEPLAVQQYISNNKDTSIEGKAKVSTYGVLKKDKNGQIVNEGILDPCSVDNSGQWGCQVFVDKLQITKVGKQNDHPDLPTFDPKTPIPHCFWDSPE